jgi:light-regulated signal transduction histidine kinase (bacteriophytochrome)
VEDEKEKFLYYESIAEDSSERRNRETELTNAVSALARSNAELERVAFVVAHDLNEPLRTIRTYVGLLVHTYGAPASPQSKESFELVSKEAVDFIMQATERMKILIDDILAFSQVDFRSSQTESVDRNSALFNVMATLEAAVKEAGAEIVISSLPPVQAQRAKMERLFQNLISNSIKFRGASPLRISIGVEAHDGRWRFYVRDHGIGFDSKYAEKIFEFFVQLDRRKYAGSGMGLAMCKRIVKLYGGKIWAESKVVEGTTISFTLPKSHTADSREWIKAHHSESSPKWPNTGYAGT